jgi:hypothetical protein
LVIQFEAEMTNRKLLAVLCVAAFALHVSTYHAAAETPSPESSRSTPTLTDDQINKIVKLGAQVNKSTPAHLDKRATVALGLTKGDEQLALIQTATKEKNGAIRGFWVLPNGGGYLLAFVPVRDSRYWYHLDKNFRLLGGVLVKIGEGTSVINAPDGQKGVNAELKEWSEFADNIVKKSAGRVVEPPPSPSPK